jgi:hypothetical protein
MLRGMYRDKNGFPTSKPSIDVPAFGDDTKAVAEWLGVVLTDTPSGTFSTLTQTPRFMSMSKGKEIMVSSVSVVGREGMHQNYCLLQRKSRIKKLMSYYMMGSHPYYGFFKVTVERGHG